MDPEVEAIHTTFGVTGEAAARAQRTDWAQTPLGPVRQWPAAMRTAVRLAMDSPQPVTLYLGDQMVIVQNDAVLAVNDQRARDASGHAAIAAYPELREYFEQMAASVRTGEAAQEPTVLIPRGIDGRMIDFWYHTAAAPIRDNGAIIGIYQAWLERTQEVLAARRLHVVNALSGQPVSRSRHNAIEQSVGILRNAPDVLFAAGYLVDLTGQRADLVAVAGVDAGGAMAPRALTSSAPAVWPLERALREGRVIELDDLPQRFPEHRLGPAAVQPERAIIYPIRDDAQGTVLALLVLGVNPRLIFDDRYRAFLRLVGETIAARSGDADRRDSEERQAFFLKLTDVLRPLQDPVAIQTAAVKLLAEELAVMRAFYFEMLDDGDTFELTARYERDAPPIPNRMRISDFSAVQAADYRNGRTLVLCDSETEAQPEAYRAIGVCAAAAVPLVKGGQLVALVAVNSSSPRKWTKTEIQILEELAERTWAAVERAKAEQALKRSEEKYRTLFETMGQGYTLCEVVRDEAGTALDIRVLEVNPAYERLMRVPAEAARGRLVYQLHPQVDRWWLDNYDRVVRAGTPERLEYQEREDGRWFAAWVYPRGGDRFVALFEDITERKRRELNAIFLADIGRDLSVLSEPDEIIGSLGARLGEFLHVATCIFSDVDEDKNEATIRHGWNTTDVPSLKQTFRLGDYFGEEFRRAGRAGETVIVRNTARDERANAEAYARLRIGAFVSVPFQRDGRWTANVTVTTSEPREWRADEIQLLEDVASRVFPRIERARAETALRESEARLRLFGEASTDVLWIRDTATLRWTYLSPAFEQIYGRTRESVLGPDDLHTWLDLVVREDRERALRMIERVRAGERVTFEYRILWPDGTVRWVRNTDFPIHDADGVIRQFGGTGRDVTDEKHAEAALRASEEKFRTVFHSIDEGFVTAEVIYDDQGRAVDALYLEGNPAASRLTGGRDYDHRLFSELVPEAEGYWVEIYDRVARSGTPERLERFLAPLDRWYNFHVSRVSPEGRANNGGPRVAIVFNDVTDRRRAEDALRESEERLRGVLDSMREGFAHFDPDFTIVDVNEETLRLDGRSREELVGRSHWAAFPGTEHSPLGDLYRRVMRERVAGSLEHHYTWPDGRDMWVDVRAYPTADGGVACFWRDVTARRHAEHVLRASEEQFRRSIEEAPIPVMMHAEDGEVLQVSRTWMELTGFTLEEVPTFDAWLTRAYGTGANAVRDHVQALFAGNRRTMSADLPVRTRSGEERHWSFSASAPGTLRDGRRFVVGMALDITDRRRAEEALRASEERLRRLNEQLEERVRERTSEVRALFQRLVSAQEEERRRIARDIHDQVGQQMTALRMNLETLRSQAAGRTALVEQAERTQRLAEELDQSIDFLTWQLRPAALDHLGLSAALQNLVTGWSERFGVAADLAVDAVEDVRLPRDVEANLYRIAQEALHNIAKHAHATQVTVYLAQQDGHLVLLIEDNGRGFDSRRTQRPDGGGMGLMSMQERAALVGGQLDIESIADHGTSIYVRIPQSEQGS